MARHPQAPALIQARWRDSRYDGSGYVWQRRWLGHPYRRSYPHVDAGIIDEKPGIIDGQIAIREYLSLTISFDHDIIDGTPAARFTQRLQALIESGFGVLDQETTYAISESKQEPVAPTESQ